MKFKSRLKQLFYCVLFIVSGVNSFAQSGVCPANIDFEFGDFTNWNCYTGTVASVRDENVITVTPSGPVPGRHTMIDASSAGVLDPYGNFPVLCPNGSGYSIKLGNNGINKQAERVSYSFTIPPGTTEYSLVYQYAVVLQDPSHLPPEQPRFQARVYDLATNQYVSCATFDFVATSNLPGFERSTVATNVWYKPWTAITLNLSNYAGRTVVLEFTTADCTQGAHFGYAYIDVNIGCTSPVSGASFCPGATSLTLNAPFGYQSYSWYNSDMSQLIGTQPTLVISPLPATNTVYALDIIPFPGFGCRDTVFTTIKPAEAPLADAGLDRTICYGSSVNIGSAPIPGLSYNWIPSSGLDNPGNPNPLASPLATTSYIVTATNLSSGCTRQDTVKVEVSPQLASGFSVNSQEQCIDLNRFHFTNSSPPVWPGVWKFGDGSFTSQNNPEHRYQLSGTYPVSYIVTSADGCQDSTVKNVIVHDLPSGGLGASATNICDGTPVSLTVSGGVSYNWYRDGRFVGTVNTNIYNAIEAGTYTFNITDQYGCKNAGSNSIALTFTKKPEVDFSFDKYCLGLPTNFFSKSKVDNSLPVKYAWDFGNSNSSSQKDTVIKFTEAGSYHVKLSVTPLSCPQLLTTAQKTVTIERPVSGESYVARNAVDNKPLQLEARNIGASYEWTPSKYLGSIFNSRTVYTGDQQQLYTIRIITPSGCTTIDTQLVRVFKESEIYVPKAFTPNNDGQNDRMYPFLVGIKELIAFRIMNRWGTVLYESKTDLPGWDGSYKGKPQPVDGYVWEAQAVDLNGETILRKGTFTLIR